jgi:hypothetical protein
VINEVTKCEEKRKNKLELMASQALEGLCSGVMVSNPCNTP